MFPTNPDLQIESEKIEAALSNLGPEELMTYRDINDLVGYDVIKTKRWVVMRAKQRVEKRQGLRFATVNGQGIKKLAATSLPGIGAVSRKRIGRIAKKDAARLTELKYNDIDSRLQSRIDAERSLLGAISAVASTHGNHVVPLTRTGPIVAKELFDHIRPSVEAEQEDA